jgi:hypothetical protein
MLSTVHSERNIDIICDIYLIEFVYQYQLIKNISIFNLLNINYSCERYKTGIYKIIV